MQHMLCNIYIRGDAGLGSGTSVSSGLPLQSAEIDELDVSEYSGCSDY